MLIQGREVPMSAMQESLQGALASGNITIQEFQAIQNALTTNPGAFAQGQPFSGVFGPEGDLQGVLPTGGFPGGGGAFAGLPTPPPPSAASAPNWNIDAASLQGTPWFNQAAPPPPPPPPFSFGGGQTSGAGASAGFGAAPPGAASGGYLPGGRQPGLPGNPDLFNEQAPQNAFLRFMTGLRQQGGLTDPVRGLLERRGATLVDLAPFFGFGMPQGELGGFGRGQDPTPFFQQQLGGLPSLQDRRALLQNIQAAHGAAATGGAGFAATPQAGLLGAWNDIGQQEQPGFVANLLTAGNNPFMTGGFRQLLTRRLAEMAATNPRANFLDEARAMGYF